MSLASRHAEGALSCALLAALAIAACDSLPADHPRTTQPEPKHARLVREAPDDKRYVQKSTVSVMSGSTKLARERLLRDADREKCDIVLLTRETSEDVPGEDGKRRYVATGDCYVERELVPGFPM